MSGPTRPFVNNTPSAASPTMRTPVSRCFVIAAAALALAACTTAPRKESSSQPAPEGKYYKDDGPGETPPAGLDALGDAVPRIEPLHRFANRPYTVFGREYVPATSLRPYKERGVASWYGRKFHGEKTSTGEIYDMYAMTAAHPTLPLPSYARVTSVATGKSVVVRVNDRGPFLHNRVIDLSYAAANKIGIAPEGQRRRRGGGDHSHRDGRNFRGRAATPGRRRARPGKHRHLIDCGHARGRAGRGVARAAGRRDGERVRRAACGVREQCQRRQFRRPSRALDRLGRRGAEGAPGQWAVPGVRRALLVS